MATFSASATGTTTAKGVLKSLSTVSYNRTVYINLVGEDQQKEWSILADTSPASSYTATFSGLEPGTTYTCTCSVYKNSPWTKIFDDSVEITTDEETPVYTVKAVNKTSTGISSVEPTSEDVEEGTEVDFSAELNSGYIFRGWFTSSTSTTSRYLESRDNPYSIIITEDLTLYARAVAATLEASTIGSDSLTLTFSPVYDEYTYYIRVWDATNEVLKISQRQVNGTSLENGYELSGLSSSTRYAINIGYKDESNSTINWIWTGAPEFTTLAESAVIKAKAYIQEADGSYSYQDVYSFDATVGESYDIPTFANTILTTYLKSEISSKLYANIEFAYMTEDGGTTQYTKGDFEITKSGEVIVCFYYKRVSYTMTIKSSISGVDYFTINNVSFQKGATASFLYEQSIKIKAVLLEGYAFVEWIATPTTITAVNGKTSNPLTFTMPASDFTISVETKEASLTDPWEWTSAEIDAFEGAGAFSVLTATRWNSFLDWCNVVISAQGGTSIGSGYYGEKGEPLYASDFNRVLKCIRTVTTVSTIPSSVGTGDIVYGSYFIDLAAAMNKII